jgi:hypothetical protein
VTPATRTIILASLATGAAGFALGEAVAWKAAQRSFDALEISFNANRNPGEIIAACTRVEQQLARIEAPTVVAAPAPPATGGAPLDGPQPTDDNERARAEATGALAAAVDAGAWTPNDALTFRTLAARMAPADASALRQRLAQALDGGAIKKTYLGAPY